MGNVYRARMEGPGGAAKEVALKLVHRHLSADRNFVLMFLDEMRVAMAMAHRNIVQTFDAGEADGHHFMVMELVNGCSLRELLGRVPGEQRMPLDIALFIAMEVSAALGYAHGFHPPTAHGQGSSGVIHRDVSPANILLSAQGDVKLADFGVAKVAGGLHVTGIHHVKGKLAYMAPEQARGVVEPRSDLFALGAVLYRMIAAAPIRRVLDLESVRLGAPGLARPSTLRPDLPASLEELMLRCLAADPAKRPATAEELRRALAEEAFRLQLEGDGGLDPHARLQAFIAAASEGEPSTSGSGAGKLGAMLLQEAGALATDHGEPDWVLAPTLIEPVPAPRSDRTACVDPAHLVPRATAPLVPQPTLSEDILIDAPRRRWVWLLVVGLGVLAGAVVGVSLSLRSRGPKRPEGTDVADAALPRRPDASAGAALRRRPDASADPRRDGRSRLPDAPPRADVTGPDLSAATRRTTVPLRPATLDLNTIPWSQVTIDGHHRGHTPLQGIQLRPGHHRLRFVNAKRGLSREITLQLRPGQRLRRVIELKGR